MSRNSQSPQISKHRTKHYIGIGGMSGYLQFLLAPVFLEVILVTKEVSKYIFQKFFNFSGLPPKNPILASLAKNWLFESRKGLFLRCFVR